MRFRDLNKLEDANAKGKVIEFLFQAAATMNGLKVTHIRDGYVFDHLVGLDGKVFNRVQTKLATLKTFKDGRQYISVTCTKYGGKSPDGKELKVKYEHKDIDYFALYSCLTDKFYTIPVSVFPEGKIQQNFQLEYPDGTTCPWWLPYKEAWHLFKPNAEPATLSVPVLEMISSSEVTAQEQPHAPVLELLPTPEEPTTITELLEWVQAPLILDKSSI